MGKIFKKITIIFTLIFSFLISIIPNTNVVSAGYSSEVVYEKVAINDVSVNGNTIRVKLAEELDVLAFTYEYAYLDVEGVKVSQLATCSEIKKLSDVDFSFFNNSGKELIGVKIWKVQYSETETYRPDYMSSGNNEWSKVGTTGIDGSQRLKTLQVTKNKLTYNNMEFDDYGLDDFFKFSGYSKDYTGILFFSLDNEEQNVIMESIYRIEVRLVTYENTWSWWGASQKVDQNRTTHEVEIYEDYTTSTNRVNGVVVEDTPMVGAGLNSDGYDWYVLFNNQLKDKDGNVIDLSAEASFSGFKGSQTYLDEVAIMNLTYVYDGEFFDVEVLDFGTGITVYHYEKEWYDKVWDWFNNLFGFFARNIKIIAWITIGVVVLIVIGFINKILELLHLDKKSREIRKMKKILKKQRKVDEVERLQGQLNNSYISSSKLKNKKVARYVKNGKH